MRLTQVDSRLHSRVGCECVQSVGVSNIPAIRTYTCATFTRSQGWEENALTTETLQSLRAQLHKRVHRQKRTGTILPLRRRSVSKGWHRERIQCRVEAHWDTSVRCNILPAGDRPCGLVHRTEGLSMAPLRLWTDTSYELLSQKLQKKRKRH